MMGAQLIVADDMVVGLDYTLRLDDGELIDTSSGDAPFQLLQGHGQIVVGLERALYGMAVGDQKHIVVAPADGYGVADPESFEVVPLDAFPPDLELTPGMHIHMRDQSDRIYQVRVAKVHPDGVLLDFNHPLAGETLHFDVKIATLRPATRKELAHGHTHGKGHTHQ
jgi:FKBP-type peptidyl-prolyl cis-trans isomerase SlyD